MLIIDSQIWIFYFDINSLEHSNVKLWLEGSKKNGVLFTSQIILNAIIPIEIAHNLYSMQKLAEEKIEKLIFDLISLKNAEMIGINQNLVLEALKILKKFRLEGIGGRDALILATMKNYPIRTIVTHDKNILAINDIKRIDPVFNPPLILEIGKNFDRHDFKEKIKEIT